MTQQTNALRLADALQARRSNTIRDNTKEENAAIVAELRRLDAVEKELREALSLAGQNYEFQRKKADGATATVYAFHHAMKDAGWHPGRTDDDLTDIIRQKGKALAEAEAERDQLRAQVERLQGGEPVAWQSRFNSEAKWTECSKEFAEWVRRAPSGFPEFEVRNLFDRAQPAAPAHEPIEVSDAMALSFHNAITDGPIGRSEVEEIRKGLKAALANVEVPAAPALVPLTDERIEQIVNEPCSPTCHAWCAGVCHNDMCPKKFGIGIGQPAGGEGAP